MTSEVYAVDRVVKGMEELAQRVSYALQMLRRSMESDMLQRLHADITGPQMFVLYYINERGSCKLSQLADRLDVKPSAITVMIDRMEKSGHVKRTHDTVDRRSILVELTPGGKEVLKTAMRLRHETIAGYLAKLEPGEDRVVTELLEKMADIQQTGNRKGREA